MMLVSSPIALGADAQLAQNNLAFQEVALAMKADLLRSQIRLELARADLSSEPSGGGQAQAPAGLRGTRKRSRRLGI